MIRDWKPVAVTRTQANCRIDLPDQPVRTFEEIEAWGVALQSMVEKIFSETPLRAFGAGVSRLDNRGMAFEDGMSRWFPITPSRLETPLSQWSSLSEMMSRVGRERFPVALFSVYGVYLLSHKGRDYSVRTLTTEGEACLREDGAVAVMGCEMSLEGEEGCRLWITRMAAKVDGTFRLGEWSLASDKTGVTATALVLKRPWGQALD